MKLRLRLEAGAGVILWTGDAESRQRWTAVVDLGDLGLNESLQGEAAALAARFDALIDWDDPGGCDPWARPEAAALCADARAWAAQVRAALGPDWEIVDEVGPGAPPPDLPAGAGLDDPGFTGEVVACFASEAQATAARVRWEADFGWRESVTFSAVNLPVRTDGCDRPETLLARLAQEPGFAGGWWQRRESGPDLMLDGDPTEHAILALGEGNATGWVNFLRRVDAAAVELAADQVEQAWRPGPMHRLRPARAPWWEWWSFFRAARRVLQGKPAGERYRQAESKRLRGGWEHGGSAQGWPARWSEALARGGFERAGFTCWRR